MNPWSIRLSHFGHVCSVILVASTYIKVSNVQPHRRAASSYALDGLCGRGVRVACSQGESRSSLVRWLPLALSALFCILLDSSASWAALWVLIGCRAKKGQNTKCQTMKRVPEFRGPGAASRFGHRSTVFRPLFYVFDIFSKDIVARCSDGRQALNGGSARAGVCSVPVRAYSKACLGVPWGEGLWDALGKKPHGVTTNAGANGASGSKSALAWGGVLGAGRRWRVSSSLFWFWFFAGNVEDPDKHRGRGRSPDRHDAEWANQEIVAPSARERCFWRTWAHLGGPGE